MKEVIEYKLLKDLPALKAGAKFRFSKEHAQYVCYDDFGKLYSYFTFEIESLKDFFEKVY